MSLMGIIQAFQLTWFSEKKSYPVLYKLGRPFSFEQHNYECSIFILVVWIKGNRHRSDFQYLFV